MSEAPERIWARTTTIACGSWDDYKMVESRLWSPYDSEGSVEYVRADRIEELEAKLAKAVAFLGELWDSQGYDARELHDLLKELDGDNQ